MRLLRRGGPGLVLTLAEPTIEPDNAGESGCFCRGEERDSSAEAETEDERPASVGLFLEMRAARRDIREQAFGSGLADVGHVLEVVGATIGSSCSAEVVEGDRVDTG